MGMTTSREGIKQWQLIDGWEKVPKLHNLNKVGETVRCGRRLYTVIRLVPFQKGDYIYGTNKDHAFELRCKSNGEVMVTQAVDSQFNPSL